MQLDAALDLVVNETILCKIDFTNAFAFSLCCLPLLQNPHFSFEIQSFCDVTKGTNIDRAQKRGLFHLILWLFVRGCSQTMEEADLYIFIYLFPNSSCQTNNLIDLENCWLCTSRNHKLRISFWESLTRGMIPQNPSASPEKPTEPKPTCFRETRPRPTSTLSDTQGHRGPCDKCKWAPINLF